MLNNNYIYFLYILSLFLTSCSSFVYYPQLNNVPLIEEKGELQINAGIAFSPVNATITYSPLNNLSLIGYGEYSKNNKSLLLGMGYYNKTPNDFIYEIYGLFNNGYGNGFTINPEPPEQYYGDTEFKQYALQINCGKRLNFLKNFEYAFSIKPFYLNSRTEYMYNPFKEKPYQINISDKTIGIEPQLSLKIGSDNLRFYIQTGYCWTYKFTNKDLDDTGFLVPFNIGVGLSSRFNLSK